MYRLAARHDDAIPALSESIAESKSMSYPLSVANGLRALGDVLQERGSRRSYCHLGGRYWRVKIYPLRHKGCKRAKQSATSVWFIHPLWGGN